MRGEEFCKIEEGEYGVIRGDFERGGWGGWVINVGIVTDVD